MGLAGYFAAEMLLLKSFRVWKAAWKGAAVLAAVLVLFSVAMQKDQGFWPATVYMEGLDQYRGWFQSSLLTAVGAFGKGAPFKECITHGWTVDEQGKAMCAAGWRRAAPTRSGCTWPASATRFWAIRSTETKSRFPA